MGVFAAAASAADLVPVPSPASRVVDVSGTLTPSEQASLENRLADIEARKGAQIAVLLVPTTGPEALEQYALRVAEAWKPGREKEDDGLVFLVAVKDRAVRFETGYGLEGVLPDALANRILDDLVIPRFREGDYAGGLDAGVTAVEQVLDGTPPPAASGASGGRGREGGGALQLLLIAAGVAVFLLPALLGRVVGGFAAGAAVGALTWMLLGSLVLGALFGVLALVFGMTGLGSLLAAAQLGGMGRRRGGGFGGFGGGGFGGSGGGFGGFGGGSFGGGGASGRW